MTEKPSTEKRPHNEVEGNVSEVDPKKKKTEAKCAFWIEKKSRNCLTAPVNGYTFCQVHLDRTPDLTRAKVAVSEVATDVSEDKKVRCAFWVARKKRYCKCIPHKNSLFCVEHSQQEDGEKKRIPCPYDSKHSCYESQLQSHLNKCNSRPALRPVFYEESLNSGLIEESGQERSLQEVSRKELQTCIDKINALFKKHQHLLQQSERFHPSLKESLNDATNGQQALKHLKQIASLVGNLEDMSLLKAATTYIEFGAGRGGLSHWIQKANPSDTCRFVLIDRSSVRYKKDNYHKGEEQGPTFERLKIDIQHLAMDRVESLKEGANGVVCVGKHLCGAATDFMLRCLVNAKDYIDIRGMVVALCCHHRCSWGAYVGREWLLRQGIDRQDFVTLVKMSAWATCGTTHVHDDNQETTNTDTTTTASTAPETTTASYSHPRYGDLLPQQREEIGLRCKRLLDIGRLMYLQENHYRCNLIQYVSSQTTLENYALTALFKTTEER